MIKQINKIKSNTLDFKNLEENHLSIQLSLDGFSFCIYNKVVKDFCAFGLYEFEQSSISPYQHLDLVSEIFQQEELLQLKYKSVSVSHFNNLNTQVPEPFFEKDKLNQYLKYSVKVLENDFIAYDTLKNTDIVNVYIPFVNINNYLIDTFGTFEYKHSSTILIEKLLHEYKNLSNDFCFINVTNNYFEIIVIKNTNFELFNCFKFKTKEDFIYYILFTAEQLNLNPEDLKLVLLGDIEKDSELYSILYQYIRNISFYTPSNASDFLKSQISEHSNFTLLNQL